MEAERVFRSSIFNPSLEKILFEKKKTAAKSKVEND